MAKLSLVIMAAGLGSRYGAIKQLAPIGPNGETGIEYAVYDARHAGFERAVFIIRKEMEKAFRQQLGKWVEQRMETVYVFQELDALPRGHRAPPERKKPWGTGHAILCCRKSVKDAFAVINADDFYGALSYHALANLLRNNRDAKRYAMVGFKLKNTLSAHGAVSRGVCDISKDDVLLKVTERTDIRKSGEKIEYAEGDKWNEISGETIVSLNMWGFMPSVFDELGRLFEEFLRERGGDPKAEFFLPSVVTQLLEARQIVVKVLRTNETWFGLTYLEDLLTAQTAIAALISRGGYPRSIRGS